MVSINLLSIKLTLILFVTDLWWVFCWGGGGGGVMVVVIVVAMMEGGDGGCFLLYVIQVFLFSVFRLFPFEVIQVFCFMLSSSFPSSNARWRRPSFEQKLLSSVEPPSRRRACP